MMDEIEDEADRIGDSMAEAFERAGERIEAAMSRAAETGEMAFSRMTESLLRELAKLAVEQIVVGPAEAAIGGVIGQNLAGLPFMGARAGGGPVMAGGSYLVGETGAEIFTPDQPGRITAAQPVQVTVNLSAPALPKQGISERSLARHIARAVSRGQAAL